jgi:hypothetical protein
MLINCQHCHTPFTLSHENILTALDQLEDNGWKHYNAYCPRCGRANVVGREQLMRFAPEWTPGGLVSPRPEPVTAPPEPEQATPKPKPATKPGPKAAAKQAKKASKPAKKAASKKPAAKKKAAKAKPKAKSKPAAKKKSKKK